MVFSMHLKRLSHQAAFPLRCHRVFFFPEHHENEKNHDIFCEKLSVTASLQQPRCCHGALMAFYPVPTVFMVEILCALTVLTLRVHGAHSTCVALSGCCHCVEDTMTSPRTPCSLCANTTDDHSVCTTTLVCAMELLLHCSRPYCAAMVTLRRPLCALLGTPSNDVCFEYAKSAHRCSAFYWTPLCPLGMPLCSCGDACVHTARTSHSGITVTGVTGVYVFDIDFC